MIVRRLLLIILVMTSCLHAATIQESFLYRKAQEQYQNNDIDGAIQSLQKAISSGEDSGEVYRFLGDVYMKVPDLENAFQAYDDALIRLEGKPYYNALYNKANAHLKSRDLPMAVNLYKDVLEENPDNMNVKQNLEIAIRLLKQQQSNGGGQEQEEEEEEQQQEQQEQETESEQQVKQMLNTIEKQEQEARRKYNEKPEKEEAPDYDW